MPIAIRWAMLLAACTAAAVALRLRSKPRNAPTTNQAALSEWESEGGTVAAPSPETGTRPATASSD
jgi:hypothetical protein